jgi:hypothetical protein
VTVDAAIVEARQQRLTLRAILGELRQHGVAAARPNAERSAAAPSSLPPRPEGVPAAAELDNIPDLFGTG